MATVKLEVSKKTTIPTSLPNGQIEYVKNADGVVYQYVGDGSGNPTLISSTLENRTVSLIQLQAGDELTILNAEYNLVISSVKVVKRGSGLVDFTMYSNKQRDTNTSFLSVPDFNENTYADSDTTGEIFNVGHLVSASEWVWVVINDADPITELVFHITYHRQQ